MIPGEPMVASQAVGARTRHRAPLLLPQRVVRGGGEALHGCVALHVLHRGCFCELLDGVQRSATPNIDDVDVKGPHGQLQLRLCVRKHLPLQPRLSSVDELDEETPLDELRFRHGSVCAGKRRPGRSTRSG